MTARTDRPSAAPAAGPARPGGPRLAVEALS